MASRFREGLRRPRWGGRAPTPSPRPFDLHLRSVVLADFLRRTCGGRSDTKIIPDFVFAASNPCVAALLRAYFEGDGNISVPRRVIRASSNSKELIDGLCLLLARFGIFSNK